MVSTDCIIIRTTVVHGDWRILIVAFVFSDWWILFLVVHTWPSIPLRHGNDQFLITIRINHDATHIDTQPETPPSTSI